MGLRDRDMVMMDDSGTVWKVRPENVKVMYAKSEISLAVSQVRPDTWNQVGIRRDHPPRLNTGK